MYWLTGIVGAVLMAAPYIFNFADNQAAVWTSLITGFVVVVASLWEGIEIKKEDWEYWVAGVMGVIAILSPFALGFGNYEVAMSATVILGGIITVLAVSKLWAGGPTRI